MNLTQQKYILITFIAGINVALITTFIHFIHYWYVYLIFLIPSSFINAICSLLNIGYKLSHLENNKNINIKNRIEPKNYLYIVPCYNESEDELRASLHSLINQRLVKNDKRTIIIICDGIIKGAGNNLTTDEILKKILNIPSEAVPSEAVPSEAVPSEAVPSEAAPSEAVYRYTTWDGTMNTIHCFTTEYTYTDIDTNTNKSEPIKVILLIKLENYGKRDSLVIARKICYAYNFTDKKTESSTDTIIKDEDTFFINSLIENLAEVFSGNIDYIIGIDADTVFDYNCTYELIQSMELDKDIHGCVGFVDICPKMNYSSIFLLYQYAEYIFAQCLRRQTQSNITHKVNCLSGCNQILRISEETCGEKILKIFNYLPKKDEHILKHIRSYASEDRNHVCNMLSLYPHVKTVQNLKAVAYTVVPTSISVFLSQRRRWNLGANSNDLLLVYLPGINLFERFLAFTNVFTFITSPFIYVATIYFILAIIFNPSLLMLYLSIILFIPLCYSLIVPIMIKPMNLKDAMYYYISYIVFVALSGLVSLITFLNAVLKMDVIKWGKTRAISWNKELDGHDNHDDNHDDNQYDDNNIIVINKMLEEILEEDIVV